MPHPSSSPRFLEPSQAAGRAFVARQWAGPVVMLNLLRFRALADYSAWPELAPPSPISGRAAFERYVAHTLPFLHASGGELLFAGEGDALLVGPAEERWDMTMLIRHRDAATFLGFASHAPYLAGLGHRLAALEDARLLPITDCTALLRQSACHE